MTKEAVAEMPEHDEAPAELDAERARKLLQEEIQARVAKCQKAVGAALDAHKCHIEPHLIVTQQGNQFAVRIVPNAENQ